MGGTFWFMAGVMLCVVAERGSAARPPAGHGAGRGELRRLLLRHYDGNRDGILSQEEWAQLRTEMQRGDRRQTSRSPRRALRGREEMRRGGPGPFVERGPRADRGGPDGHRAASRRPGGPAMARRGSRPGMEDRRPPMWRQGPGRGPGLTRDEILRFDRDGDERLSPDERSELRRDLRRRMEERFNRYVDRVLRGEGPSPAQRRQGVSPGWFPSDHPLAHERGWGRDRLSHAHGSRRGRQAFLAGPGGKSPPPPPRFRSGPPRERPAPPPRAEWEGRGQGDRTPAEIRDRMRQRREAFLKRASYDA